MFVSSKSQAAREICNAHYGDDKHAHCAGCPLISKCHMTTPGSMEAFNNWMDGVNEAAREHKEKNA